MSKKINWGIIGCGDVTEIKSGPAFNKVENSSLVAVMRRDEMKVKDYAQRHAVPKWYTNANDLINDEEVNAIYIATPPSSHEEYTLAALAAGKPVYVEKPMTVDTASAERMLRAAATTGVKLTVAHYRRVQPFFLKLKELIDAKIIGDVRLVQVNYFKKAAIENELEKLKNSWRVDPSISGGGLFHDLAPHQLDLVLYLFGEWKIAKGFSLNQSKAYSADDVVVGNSILKNGIAFNGVWCFNAAEEKDTFEVIGTKGKINFSVFDNRFINIEKEDTKEIIEFEMLQHVQQPMIEQVVSYFLNKCENPCSVEDGLSIMRWMDAFTKK
jgi:predicted dehydrogenase